VVCWWGERVAVWRSGQVGGGDERMTSGGWRLGSEVGRWRAYWFVGWVVGGAGGGGWRRRWWVRWLVWSEVGW
jgi:hypothetical protein